MLWLQFLINALQLGAIHALAAVGFSLIFGSTKIFHVAHGAIFALAGYAFYAVTERLGLHWSLGVLAALLAAVGLALLINRLVYQPIQRHEGSFFTIFVASFGVGIVVQNLIGIGFGRGYVTVSSAMSRSIELTEGVFVSPLAGIALLCGVVFLWLTQLVLTRTHVGIALRALSDNKDMVQVYGIDAKKLSVFVFALAACLTVPGAVIASMTSGLNPGIGGSVMLISIAATIVGGVGSIKGAACAGLLLGAAETLAVWKLDPQWSEAATFVVLFVFILFRPSGFFGQAVKN